MVIYTFKKTIIFAILQTVTASISGDSVTDGTELVSTFFVNRHGDRTPTESSLEYTTTATLEALRPAIEKYGYGQLTKVGKQRAYQLGKFIRKRYNELLSCRYNRSEIYIRSTDVDRTEMTVLTAMAAVYPAYPGSWSDKINWVPTPYTTVPVKYDYLKADLSCPTFVSATDDLLMQDNPRMAKYKPVLEVLSSRIGVNLTAMPVMVVLVNDIIMSQLSLGICLDETIAALLPEIKAAADEGFDILYGNDKLKILQSGPLLKEFFTSTAEQMSGSSTPRVRIYSAHDDNVYAMEAVCDVPRQGQPKYAAALGLELYRDLKTGQYYVLVIYLPTPGKPVKYLPVKGCSGLLCPYEEFKKIVSPNILDECTYKKECGVTEDCCT